MKIERERYRCVLHQGRGPWCHSVRIIGTREAHISFVGAGAAFLDGEHPCANTTLSTATNSNRKKNNELTALLTLLLLSLVDAMNHLQLEKLRVFVSKIKNQKETFSCFAVIKH